MQSDRFPSADGFVQEFLRTLRPGIIPTEKFIDWNSIDEKVRKFSYALEFFDNTKYKELQDALLSDDSPGALVKCAFELIAHTSSQFATADYEFNINDLGNKLSSDNAEAARLLIKVLDKLGFERVLSRGGLSNVFFGVQLGLETHRRKNVGGRYFQDQVRQLLERVLCELARDLPRLVLEKEYVLGDSTGNSKRVDFCVLQDSRPRVAIEVNFYTVAGSKPTEIKRSYGQVRQWMKDSQIELVWITDGKGYRNMKRSLKDAFSILPTTYNFWMADTYLAEDLREILGCW